MYGEIKQKGYSKTKRDSERICTRLDVICNKDTENPYYPKRSPTARQVIVKNTKNSVTLTATALEPS